ncbi:MAG: SCO family protein [Polaromonas sp.]|nr:SCO family protein [Polaromonas sp.]
MVYVVDFIYTRCPTVCQALGSEFFRMQEALRSEGVSGIRLLSVSLDPAVDGRAELAAYARLHKADPAFWTVAAPERISQGLALMRKIEVIAIADGWGGYVHNSALHVMDADGRVSAILDHADWEMALAEAMALQQKNQP